MNPYHKTFFPRTRYKAIELLQSMFKDRNYPKSFYASKTKKELLGIYMNEVNHRRNINHTVATDNSY